MASNASPRKILITAKDLKSLHRLSRSLIKDLQELRRDPHLSRRNEIVQQLDEAIQNARDTKETLREIYIRESVWSKKTVCHKSTQTSSSEHKGATERPHSKQWDRVGQMVGQMKQTISHGSGKLDLPIVNESISHRHHEWWCEQSNQHLVPTLEHWLDLWAAERGSSGDLFFARQYLTQDATAILVRSLVISRLDYMNGLLYGLPERLLHKLQLVQNHAARLVFRKRKTEHVTPLLQQLHWLPIKERIKYKINLLTFKALNGFAPEYITELLQGGISGVKMRRRLKEADEIVDHFQKLFDVPRREGVYPRLNEVYNRLGELMNVLHVLRDMLGLDEDEPISRVVTVVRKLCDLHSESSTHLLRYLLQADDLDRMILKIDEYNKFFPVFERVAKELMTILDVDSLNHLIPAVKALKLLQP